MRVAPIFLVACLTAVLVPPACASPPPEVTGWLQPVVDEAYGATDPARRGDLLTALVDRGAYVSAAVLAGEALGVQQGDAAWEAAQAKADYRAAYLEATLLQFGSAATLLKQAGEQLEAATASGIARDDAGRLLLAARLTVEADAAAYDASHAYNAMLASKELTTFHRLGFGRGTGVATVAATAALAVLEGFEPSGGEPLDVGHALGNAALVGALQPGVLTEAGPAFTIAKAIRQWETRFRADPAETLGSIEEALEDAATARRLLVDAGIGTERFDSVVFETEAWLAEAETRYAEPQWVPLVSTLYGQVRGAQFEAEMLTLDAPPEGGDGFGLRAVGGLLLVAGALAVLVWRRRRAGSSEAKALLAILLVASVAHAVPDVSAATVDPETAPAPVPESTGVAAMGNLVRLDDGRLQFVWSEQQQGVFVLMERKYDPAAGSWTAPTKVHGDSENSNSPRLLKVGSQVHLFWMRGYDASPDLPPVEIWWCILGAQGCTGARAVTAPDLCVLQFAVSAAPDGDLWLVYSEWKSANGAQVGKVQARARVAGAWKDPVLLDDGSLSQTVPAVAAVADGAHVAWHQVPKGSAQPHKTGQLRYTFLPDAGGVTASEQVPGVPRGGGLALHASGDRLTLLFDQASGENRPVNLYEIHRTGGGAFSAPSNVSRGLQNPLWPTLQTTADGSLVAVWTESDQVDGFVLRAAIQRDTSWSRPLTLSPAGYSAVLASFAMEPSGKMAVAWSGSGGGVTSTQLFFRRLTPVWPSLPPSIVGTDPDSSRWIGGEPVLLRVHVIADWPLDGGASSVLVDGVPAQVEVVPDGLLARASGLGDGPHEAVATVRDRNTGTATAAWSFSVDRSPPSFTWRVETTDGGPAPTGWAQVPLRVLGELAPDSGAPARLEVQAEQGSWSTLPAAGLALTEGRLAQVRVRAVDEAGNVRLGNPVEAGWDATPPQVVFEGAGGWQGSPDVRVDFRDNVTAGSPVTVQVRLLRGEELLAAQTLTGLPGAARFPGVPEGRYRVEATAQDAAGHAGGSSTWELGVDRTLPRVRLTPLGDGTVQVDAEDAGSGVARVEVRRAGQLVASYAGEGRAAFQVAVPVPSGTDVAVVDGAGHETVARSSGSGFVVDDGDYDVAPRGSGEKGMPAPGLLVLALGVLLAARSRR